MRDIRTYLIIALAVLMGVFLVLWLRKAPTPPVNYQPVIDSLNRVHAKVEGAYQKSIDSLTKLHRQDSLKDLQAQRRYAELVEKLKGKKEEVKHYTCMEVAKAFQDFTDEGEPGNDTVAVLVDQRGDSVSQVSSRRMRSAVDKFVEWDSFRMQIITLNDVISAKAEDNAHLTAMNRLKDAQLAISDSLFHSAMNLNEEQAKALKKEQRKVRWLKFAAGGEAVVIMGLGIGLAIGL